MSDILKIGGKELTNRLFVGTGKFPRKSMVKDVLEKSGAQVVTVAVRRIDTTGGQEENIINYIPRSCTLMTNTSGARNAQEAVRIARLSKACGGSNWIKIEIIPDNKYLMPDNEETLRATQTLVSEGYVVLPYMNPDLVIAQKMADAGAAAIMPLGSPIGSNRGVKTKELIKILIQELPVPIIVDAGIGKPSDAALCMEMGAAAVLVNTAIATAQDPVALAHAFSLSVQAGRLAFHAGVGRVLAHAEASSPLTGFLRDS